jgi:competence protein CoiA
LFTAINDVGKRVCALDFKEKHVVQAHKRNTTFYCPVCSSMVVLKSGEKRLPHFAHRKDMSCSGGSEPESTYHLQGKLQIFKRLKDLGLKPVLEPYFPSIKQRGDIGVMWQDTYYVIEFQCSSIPVSSLQKRTEQYQKENFQPMWILGYKNVKLSKCISRLSAFQSAFLVPFKGEYILPAYCPIQESFYILHNLIPVTKEKFMASVGKIQLDAVTLHEQAVNLSTSFPYCDWQSTIHKQKNNHIHYHSNDNERFLRELYKSGVHPHILPPALGIPLREGIRLLTPPLIWQAYLYIDCFWPNQKIVSLHKIYDEFQNRITRKDITIRDLPNIIHGDWKDAVNNYLKKLIEMNVIEEVRPEFFQWTEDVCQNSDSIAKQEENFYLRMKRGSLQ